MANLKTADEVSLAGGKIGGQNFSNTKNGLVMRNTSYSNNKPTPKQSKQRFIFYALSNLWSQLDPIEKTSWQNAAIDYKYLNSIGEEITRNAFQTFSFVNQNLALIDVLPLRSAPIYISVMVPNVSIEASANNQLIIKGTNLDSSLTYVLYALPHFSNGQASIESTRLFISKLTDVQLSAGLDIIPLIKAVRATPNFLYQCTYQIIAINKTTGNKDLTFISGTGQVNPAGLGLDILSYYPFNGNANDYFNVNNPDYDNAIYDNNGIINNSASFDSNLNTYVQFPNSSSLNFENGGVVFPYSVMLWYITNTGTRQDFFNKREVALNSQIQSYQVIIRNNSVYVYISSSGSGNYKWIYKSISSLLNTQISIFYNYYADGSFEVFVNNVKATLSGSRGTALLQAVTDTPLWLGRAQWTDSYKSVGSLSELVLFNQNLNATQRTALYNANLNGQTIIDIN